MTYSPGNWCRQATNADINPKANCYFTVLRQQNFANAKYFIYDCQNVTAKANLDIYLYFLTLYVQD